jgi:hypothetical protein
VACDNEVAQIIGLTRLVGPLSWRRVQVDLILDGIYEHIHETIGTSTPLCDADRQRVQEIADRHKASRRAEDQL